MLPRWALCTDTQTNKYLRTGKIIYKLVSKDMGFPVQLCWKDPNVPLHRGGKGSTLLLQGKRRSREIGKNI